MKKIKLLSRLLVLIGVLIMNVSQALADKTIYFVNTDDWETVKCYAWQSSNTSNKNAAWHGVEMTSTELQINGHYVYSISLNDSHNKCIFNDDGSNQTSDLDVPTDARDMYYKAYGFWGFYGTIPSNVFSGDDVMFYIQGYGDKTQNYLVNESKGQASTSYKLTSAVSCVYTASSNLDTYDRISNNPGGWNGNQHTDIHDATGGELFREDGTSSTTKQTASTTASVTDGTLNISSTTSSATSAYSSLPIYIQYYIDGDFVGVTYSASTATYYSIPAGGSTARTSTYSLSGLSAGDHTLTTVLTDGILYWVADEDNFHHTWAMYSGSDKVADFTTTDGENYVVENLVINNDNNTNTHYMCSSNAYYAEAGANSLCVSKGSAPSLSFSNGQIAWQDGNGTYNIYIYNSSGTWKIYAEKTASEGTWYWIDGNGAHNGSEAVTKQLFETTAVSGVYTATRTLTKDQTFHFGDGTNGFWPKTPANSDHTDITATSSSIQLASGGSTYWFKFTPATQPVVMTLNTNTDPKTISFANPVYTISYYDQGGSAFSGTQADAPTTHTYGTATTLKIPTKTGYDFAGWYTVSDCSGGAVGTSSAASLSATGYTANINLYAKWTLKVSDITYSPSTPIGFDYTTAPSSAAYTSTVNLTISRWPGYTISVSAEDVDGGSVTVSNATSRTPSFTMPAKAVTVTVTATKINKPIVYVMKTQVAAGSNIENFSTVSGSESTTLFWGWQKGGTTNFYTSDATWNTNVALNDARAGLYTDEHGNTWYEFVSNQSSFDLETEYGVILRVKDTRNLYESNADGHYVDKTSYDGTDNHSFYKGITWLVPNGTSSPHSAQLYTSNPDGVNRASIKSLDLSATRIPPLATITATPNMYNKGAVNKAYCWGVYTDADCTSKVNSVTFSSLGDGKVQFMAPQERDTYYLKLTVHSSDDCNAAIDDEEVVSFTVTTDDMVFFKNVPGWGNVHFYFLGDAYWSETLGSGCAGRDGGAARGMTRIGNSDIYYYDYSNNSVMTTYLSSHSTCYIAFTDNYKPNSNNFSECQAVYRGDFSECAAMYVPENWITHYLNNAAYYNRGYWTNYMSANSGFSFYLWDKTANSAPGEIEIVSGAELTGTIGNNTYVYEYDFANENNHKNNLPYTYGFKIKGCGGSWYGAADDMTITKCTDWNLGTDTRKCGISVNAPLPHKFIFTLAGDGHVQVSVEYPVKEGDYRLLYNDNTQDHPHPSQYIRKRDDGKDTVAMFIRPSETENLKVQYCTGIDGETITWEDYEWNSGSAAIDVSGKADGVYVFYLEQDGSGNFNNVSNIEPYSGKYYIRTNCLDGGWNSYKTSSDNLMTYAQYPEDRGYGFNYYKAKWVGSTGTDVTYTIACDYSPSLCDTLKADPGDNPLSASEAASLPHTANIRFGWHSKTNNLKREYINGSSNVSDRYLVMIGDTKLKDKDRKALNIEGLNANEISFTDLNNWIYRCDIQAQTGAAVKLQATYDGHEQYFIGGADKTEEIIGGSSGEWYGMRVTYDFKTNRLMTAWLPNGSEIESDVVLNADMMLIREGQNAATQVYFNGNSHSISNIHTIYGVMEFKYDHMVGKFPNWSSPNAYKYLMYYISFPFDVKVSEIFGCGVRGENWIIQKYNGAKRAQIGWFKGDGTTTFWETMEGNETMNAYEGYLLLLDRITFNDPSSSLWYKQGSDNSIYLYFPSKSVTSGTISERDTTIHVPEHTCTINRTFTVDGVAGTLNHMNTDSHWNIMGTPLFQTASASKIGTPSAGGDGVTTLQFFYRWNYSDNTIAVEGLCDTTTFKSMHSYMVQYAGDVKFHGAKLTPPPPSVAARRVPSDKNYRIELQMVNTANKFSRTYVELRENACDTFALNEDLYMVRSSNMADLYTFAGAYDLAANVLTVNNHIVPVGMDVKQAGTYRFTMPSAFSGTVTLIDTQAGARTNLALGDYEVNLEKGTLNNRFQLEINIQASTTSLEGNDVKDGGAHKFIENGAMYILKNGEIFDVYGNHVR